MPSLIALVDSATPSRSRLMSLSLSRPAPSMTRNAITSVALPGEPVETRLPLRSDIFSMPLALDRHDVHAVRVEHHQGADLDLVALELVFALERVERGVDHHQRDFALLGADQLEVVDRAAGDARGRAARRARISTARSPCRRRADSRRRRCRRSRWRWCSAGRSPRRRTRAAASARPDSSNPLRFISTFLPLTIFDSRCQPAAGAFGRAGCMRCFSRTAAPMTKPNVAV